MNKQDRKLKSILDDCKSVAMVGVSANVVRPSYFVGRYLSLKGYQVHPVNPVYAGQNLFGDMTCGSIEELAATGQEIHMVDIFRRSSEAGDVVDQAIEHLLDRGLKAIWMQIGVEHAAAAARAEARGVTVIQNRCPKIEYQRLFGELRMGGFATGVISSKL
mgnify:CR=1 FL=1